MKNFNIVLVGVGGQGLIKSSDLLSYAAFFEGLDVKKAEVHGLAQRGGSLFIQVRISEKVLSPLIDKKTADFLIGYEIMEASRYLDYLKKDGTLIYDPLRILPVGFSSDEYPDNLENYFRSRNINIYKYEAMQEALSNGDSRMQNVILLRELNKYLDFSIDAWEKSFYKCFKKEVADKNLDVFIGGTKE